MSTSFAVAQAAWSRLLMGVLVRCGVEDVVVSPGSRSTPFVSALTRTSVRVHVCRDERVAGYFALGRAEASGRPVALLCTSGTAGANYFPAVIEASESHIPLLVMTSDRPPELLDGGAPQTIDQTRLYGGHVRGFFDFPVADERESSFLGGRRRMRQAVQLTRGPRPGPVHINLRARKPLEPADDLGGWETRLSAWLSEPSDEERSPEAGSALGALGRAAAEATRGVVFAGAGVGAMPRAAALVEDLEARGFLVFPEASSGLRFSGERSVSPIDAYDLLALGGFFAQIEPPDLLVQIGRLPCSRAYQTVLAETKHRFAVSLGPPVDPYGDARPLVLGSSGPRLAAPDVSRLPSPWVDAHREANGRAWAVVERVLAEWPRLSEAHVARAFIAKAPPGGRVLLGNSLPIRLVESFVPRVRNDLEIITHRGVNGIEGFAASAAGAAQDGRPTWVLLGDVAMLHDLGGLLAVAHAPNVTLCVINNDGGRIFEQLPLARRLDEQAFALWTTPHGRSFEGAAQMFDLHYDRVESKGALDEALARAQGPGPNLVEAVVAPHDVRALYSAVETELRRLWSSPS